MAIPLFAAAAGAAIRTGATYVARAGLRFGANALRFGGVWGGRLAILTAVSGLGQKVAGIGVKVAGFAATYAAIRTLVSNFVIPKLHEVISKFPVADGAMVHIFELMRATAEFVPWGEVEIVANVYFEFIFIVLSWKLAIWAYALAGKILGEIGS